MATPITIQFERADLRNDTDWFNTYYEVNKERLYRHFQATDFVFSWKNFKNWKKSAYDENGRAYSKLLTMKDDDGNPLWEKCGCGNTCDNVPNGLTRTVPRESTLHDDMNTVYSTD